MKYLLLSTISLIMGLSAATAADQKPNIIYIMSDDHAAHAIGAYGSRLAALNPTPTLDRLAKEGILFENAFCTNSICSPSRACVLTGQYAHTNGSYDLSGKVEPENQYLAIEMKKAGYETAMIGKWHLKVEPAAFDFYTVLPGQGDYHNPTFRVRGDKEWGQNTIKFEDKHSSDAITDITLDWLKNREAKDQPFFLMHHYKAPHDYFEHAARYDSYLADVDVPMPDNLWPENQPKFGSIATRGYQDELVPHVGTSIGNRNPRRSYAVDLPPRFPKDFPADYDPADYTEREITEMSYQAYLKTYLRCVKGIDDNLARLFAYLEETGQMDNTVIIYTGDQGFMLGEHDYQDKRWMYEESMRMPFLVRYPKSIPAGTRTDAIVENVDYAPTMLAFAGVDTPDYMQGKSFKSICETGQEPEGWKQEAYYRYWMHMAHHDNPGHVGIRTKTHKLIYYYACSYQGGYRTPPAWELYDLEKDPLENVNQYSNPEYREIVTELKDRLAALRQRVGDTGEDFPACEAVLQEFWDYDGDDQASAIALSSYYRQRREAELLEKTFKDIKPEFLLSNNSLAKWTYEPKGWEIWKDGTITCNMKTVKDKNGKEKQVGMGYIWTKKDYSDFSLSLEYKLSPGANSGVFYRTDPSNPVQGGFEIQLMDNEGFQKNKGKPLSANKLNGSFYDGQAPDFDPSKPVGQWNRFQLICKGPNITVKINNKPITYVNVDNWDTAGKNPDGSDNKFKTALKDLPRSGKIGLQNHGQKVWFRKMQIKEL